MDESLDHSNQADGNCKIFNEIGSEKGGVWLKYLPGSYELPGRLILICK